MLQWLMYGFMTDHMISSCDFIMIINVSCSCVVLLYLVTLCLYIACYVITIFSIITSPHTGLY